MISGKVNMLSYNRSFADQFYQRYFYDDDNRITQVETSGDGLIWNSDARYTYYEHGPLARVDIGDLRVQGMDFAYTIQGWLKYMNGDSLNDASTAAASVDMGHDAEATVNAKDVVSYSIDYFKNDYKAVGPNVVGRHLPLVTKSLYNGNITGQSICFIESQGMSWDRLYKEYIYDQLNRIHTADYNKIDTGLIHITDYHSKYMYDPDGNIKTLTRYGNATGGPATIMDSLSYAYGPGMGVSKNQLMELADSAVDVYSNDIKYRPVAGVPTYTYDAVGNTTMDLISGQDTIAWNLYNKVTHTHCANDSSHMEFKYDGGGNRVAKYYTEITPGGDTVGRNDYYVHDTQGNILAIYKEIKVHGDSGSSNTTAFFLSEHDIYGSSRLGVKKYWPLPETVTDAVGNITTVNSYNWYNLQPASVTDINNNISDILYDVLGMPVAVALRGKGTGTEGDEFGLLDPDGVIDSARQHSFWTDPVMYAGDLLGSATWRCIYDFDNVPAAVAMIGREIHYHDTGGTTSPLLIRLSYTDGLGRVAMHKVQAEPEVGDTTIRWIGSGKTVYNNKGKAVMQYEPYFTTTPGYDAAEAAAAVGVSPRIKYDALGRVVRTDMPDGTYTKSVWDAWKQEVWDGNDTVDDSAWLAERLTGSLISVAPEVDASVKTIIHHNTFTSIYLDTLARPVYTIQANAWLNSIGTRLTENIESYVVLDIAGDRPEVHDAMGLTSLTYSYNMLKAPVRQVSMDSGTQCMLTDAANQPIYTWDAVGNMFTHFYDTMRRPFQKDILITATSATKTLEYTIYTDADSVAMADNLNGKPYQVWDGAGLQQINQYDFKGNPLEIERIFTTDPTQHADWTSTNRGDASYVESDSYITSTTYDALSRPLVLTTPEGATTTYVYDKNGLLYSVDVDGVHGLTTGIIKSITYDAKGQRLRVQYQNDTVTTGRVITTTTYEYDQLNFRVRKIRTTRPAVFPATDTVLQELVYYYDPVGNITMQHDNAQEDVFFTGTVASPIRSYTYDAIYRLIKVTGREHTGSNHFNNWDDANRKGFGGFPASTADTVALRPYTQRYAYDKAGNMNHLYHTTTGSGSGERGWDIDSASNRVNQNVYGSDDTGGEDLTYDVRGNLVMGLNHLYDTGGTTDSMVYNEENRLEVVYLSATATAYYQYDNSGQRVRKVVEDTSTYTGKRRKYLGEWELYEEYSTSTSTVSLIRETLHIHDDTARVALIDTEIDPSDDSIVSQNTRYQFSDHLGTATLEVDYNGAIISYEEYYPFGSTSFQGGRSTAETGLKRYRYTGKERDEETGFYYHGARYYCPWMYRWLEPDPLASKFAPESAYCYGHNNPVTFTDGTGMAPEDTIAPIMDNGSPATYSLTRNVYDHNLKLVSTENFMRGDEIEGLPHGQYTINKYLPDPNHQGVRDGGNYTIALGSKTTSQFTPYSDAGGSRDCGSSIGTRVTGALTGIGGVIEMAAGATLATVGAETGIAVLAGYGIAAHGVDNAAAGFNQMITGNETNSFTQQSISAGLQGAGVPQEKANQIATYADMGLGMLGTAGAGNIGKASTIASVAKASEAAAQSAAKGWIAKDIYKMLSDRKDGGKLLEAFERALAKGMVKAKDGEEGIKKLVGNGIDGYTHELKILGALGKFRLLGNLETWTNQKGVQESIFVFGKMVTHAK